MVLLDVVVVCASLVSCVGICAGAYYLSEQRKTEITQAGIDRRAQAKLTSGESAYPSKKEWWEIIIEEGIKNPELVKLISPYIPHLMDKFVKK